MYNMIYIEQNNYIKYKIKKAAPKKNYIKFKINRIWKEEQDVQERVSQTPF